MTAQQAAKEYGKRFRSIKKSGSDVILKNSMGNEITVPKNTKVYHRGKGCFGLFSQRRDSKQSAKGLGQRFGKGSYAIGTGAYRHTHDGSAEKQVGKTGKRGSHKERKR